MQKFPAAWQTYNKWLDQAGGFKQAGDELQALLDNMIAVNVKKAQTTEISSAQIYDSSRTTTIVIVVIALLISIGLGYLISQIIARPLHRITGLLGKVAEGDLYRRANESSGPQCGDRSGEAAKPITSIIKGMQLNTRQSVKAVAEGVTSSKKTGTFPLRRKKLQRAARKLRQRHNRWRTWRRS